MLSAITTPHIFSHGYSHIPLRVKDTSIGLIENYKYVVDVVYNKATVLTNEVVQYSNTIALKLNYATPHEYNLGEQIFLNDTSKTYEGLYLIKNVPSNTSIIIDLTIQQPLSGTIVTWNVKQYKESPDLQKEIKLDLSSVVKDYVTQNFTDSNFAYSAIDTRKDFQCLIGYEGKYTFEFSDSLFFGYTGGNNVGFINTDLTSVSQVPFQIGDQIIIQQNLYEWTYDDNYFSTGDLGFSSSVAHGFEVGDTVTITGQITAPHYNGTAKVISASTYTIVVDKAFDTATPTEGGKIFGVIESRYNTTTTIKNIAYTGGGVVIICDLEWRGNIPPVSGTIKLIGGRVDTNYNIIQTTLFSVYNSYVNNLDYTVDNMSNYVFHSPGSCTFSTILKPSKEYRIEPSTKSWLLAHNTTSDYSTGAMFKFYDKGNGLIGQVYVPNSSTNKMDYYLPIGIDQIKANTDKTNYIAIDSIDNSLFDKYTVQAIHLPSSTNRGSAITYKVNDYCSMYDIYFVIWKDAHGSWISFPCKLISIDSTEFERNNYYRRMGNWDNNTFGYNSYDRGETSYFNRSRDKILLNTGYITEEENNLIKDLNQSARVYIQKPDGKIVGCILQEKEIAFGKVINDSVWQYTINATLSNNEYRL